MTQAEYNQEVESLAKDCAREAREEERELSDVIHEAVDGHQWVIYTSYHHEVLHYSRADAGERFEDMGGPDWKQGWGHVVMQAAYLVLEADVAERAQELYDEAEAESAEEEVAHD